MNERPILFSAPMVRAILAGTKTQTRRVVKWQGPKGFPHDFSRAFTDNPAGIKRLMVPYHHPDDSYDDGCAHRHYPPHGDPGDRLWVREAWRIGAWSDEDQNLAIDYCDGPRKEWIDVSCLTEDQFEKYWIQSTHDAAKEYGQRDRYEWEPGKGPCRWRPSIHMPRWACRITLEITGVRVERLQDISVEDACSEGIDSKLAAEFVTKAPDRTTLRPATLHAFSGLWESINGAGSWALNPWVWVLEFKRK